MQARHRIALILPLLAAALLSACVQQAEVAQPSAPSSAAASTEAHAGHDGHTGHSMDATPDQFGRQLYGVPHEMSPEVMAELREREVFPAYLTDEQIGRMMNAMGSNYAWYISRPDLSADYGVLILAHGFGQRGDASFRNSLVPVAEEQPTSLAIGMSMMMSDHIQLALDNLGAAGADEIIVVPALSSRYSSLMRQWEFIFGQRDEPEYATVPRVRPPVPLRFAQPMDDHPIVKEMIVDHVSEISEQPAAEQVLLIAHGPVDAADNQAQLEVMEHLADALRAQGFAAVLTITLQDDAPRDVREANVERMRALVNAIDAEGQTALVVTNLLGTRTVQREIMNDLRGLPYRYNFKGLLQHPRFADWVDATVADARNPG